MAYKVSGNLKGLPPFALRQIERLAKRRTDSEEIISLDLARELFRLGMDLRRRLGLLISRDGVVEEVVVGTNEILYLPDLGRYRLGAARLRRIRLIFADISKSGDNAKIPNDIYGDLEKLRLDLVGGVKEIAGQMRFTYAVLDPEATNGTRTEHCEDVARLNVDYQELMESTEDAVAISPQGAAIQPNAALLVGVYSPKRTDSKASMDELMELCKTAGIAIAGTFIQRREEDPRTVVGKGKLEEIVLVALRKGAELIVFDQELLPGQWRAITNAMEAKVLDRSMVILDIFAQHARSSEGKIQVELAQLRYNLPRLVEKDTGLSRLSGGIGGRGPGETKLEISRRRSRDRIALLEKQLERLGASRGLQRKLRSEREIPVVAILGYTNAGKSTLFNRLSRSDVLVEDKLFATLEPAQRRMALPEVRTDSRAYTMWPHVAIISDTVGFIRDLPKELVQAFRATLEELYEADLLLHLVDGSDEEVVRKKEAVDKIMAEMDLAERPRLVVINKLDRLMPEQIEGLCTSLSGVPISAVRGDGIDELKFMIAERLATLKESAVTSEISAE